MPQENGGSGIEAGTDSGRGRGTPPDPFDSVVDARATLSDERRRAVLDVLADVEGPLTVGGLAVRLTDLEDDDQTNARQRTFLSLSRTHVPALERHGLVEYDQAVGTVSLTVPEAAVEQLLRWWAGHERQPSVECRPSADW
jgi:DNA-binding transcriptional ArsR family regulator